jgi:WD40 repeat protein
MGATRKPTTRRGKKTPPPTLPRPWGVSLPLPTVPITASNAKQVVTLARWGWSHPSVAWSPDGARLAIRSNTGLHILDASTLVEVAQESGRAALGGNRVAWAPDGQWLATNSGEATVQLWHWNGTSLTLAKTPTSDESAKGPFRFSPDSSVLAFGSRTGRVYLWRLAGDTPLRMIEAPGRLIACLCFSHDSSRLAVFAHERGVEHPPIQLWTVADGKQVGQFPVGDFSPDRLGFTPDGTLLLANESLTSTVRGWVVADGRQLDREELTALRLPPSRCLTDNLATDADGQLLVALNNPVVEIVRPNSTVAVPLRDNTDPPGACFSPDASALVAWAGGKVSVVRVSDGVLQASREGGVGRIVALAIAPDGATAATAGYSGFAPPRVRFWRLADGNLAGELANYDTHVSGLAYTPDGTRLLVGSPYREVTERDLVSGKEVARWPNITSTCLAVSRDCSRVAIGRKNGEVQCWDLSPLAHRFTVAGHKDAVGAVAFLPDGQTILSAGKDLWGRLWRVEDGAPVAKLKHNRQVFTGAASPDGRLIATGCRDKCIYLWAASDGRPVRTIPAGRSAVRRLVWSPGSDVLASASTGGAIHLWDPATGAELAALRGHFGDVACLAFTPDGTLLISGGEDCTLRLWGLNPGD